MPIVDEVRRTEAEREARRRGWSLQQPALAFRPVIALSQLPGARGHELARRLCDDLGYALFDREIVHEIATRARVSDRVISSLDERHRSAWREPLAALLAAQPLGAHRYLDHLFHVVREVGRHGAAVIVGRGAHLILGPGEALRVLVEAPRAAVEAALLSLAGPVR